MKKKLGIILFAVAIFSVTSVSTASTASAAKCVPAGTAWSCDY
ncbi:hypothetical protein ACQKOF_13540 [Lysinibacillus sp. NPDC093190]